MKRDIKKLIVELGIHSRTLKDDVEIDFERLSEKLQKYNINLCGRSIQKLWKNIKSPSMPKKKTLDRLSIFAGFQNWDELQHAFMGK